MATADERRTAAAAVAVGTAAAAGATGVGAAGMQAVSAEKLARAVAAIVAGFIRFLAGLALLTDRYLRRTLRRRLTDLDLIDRLAREEMGREREFDRKAAERLQRDLPVVLSIPDPDARQAALTRLLSRERGYAAARAEMVTQRLEGTLHRLTLRELSPEGVYWELSDRPIEHCAICLAMHGKLWSWPVIDLLHPPVHLWCGCTLRSRGEAIGLGLIGPHVQPIQSMARDQHAALVAHEEHVEEDYDASQLRDPGGEGGGRWVASPASGAVAAGSVTNIGDRMAELVLGWMHRSGGVPEDAPPREKIAANWKSNLRGRLSKDKDALAAVKAAVQENEENSLMAAVMKRFEEDHVLVVTPPPAGKMDNVLDNLSEQNAAHRKIKGTTVVREDNVKLVGLEAQQKDFKPGAGGSTQFGLAAVLRHEYGHDLANLLGHEKVGEIIEPIDDVAKQLTGYAATDKTETFCELFAIAMDQRFDPKQWSKQVVEARRRVLAALGVKVETPRS